MDASESIVLHEVSQARQGRALYEIVEVALGVGETARAERLARAIVDATARARALSAVAHQLMSASTAGAVALAVEAEAAARSTTSSHLNKWASETVEALLSIDELGAADDLANACRGVVRDTLRRQVVLARSSAGASHETYDRLIDAVGTLHRIENLTVRAFATKPVVKMLVSLGYLDIAVSVVDEFTREVEAAPDLALRFSLMQYVIELSIAVGDAEQAQRMLMVILAAGNDAGEETEPLIKLQVENLLAIGDVSGAEARVRRLETRTTIVNCLSRVAAASARNGDWKLTERLLAEAVELLQHAAGIEDRASTAAAVTGTIARAIEHMVGSGLQDEVGKLLRMGYAMADNAVQPGERDEVLCGLVECHLSIGQIDVALELAQSIEGVDCVAIALMLCAEMAPATSARPLFVQALSLYDVAAPLTALAKVDRPVLVAFSRELELELEACSEVS